MDWLAVFAALGGAAAFGSAAKVIAEKVVEQAIARKLSAATELAKISQGKAAEHRALVARTRLEIIGAILDALYPLKLALARINLDTEKLNWIEVNSIVVTITNTIPGLEAHLGGQRPYIPQPFDVQVHSFKNDLYELRRQLAEELHRERGRQHISADASSRARRILTTSVADSRDLFSGLVVEAQRRIDGDGSR